MHSTQFLQILPKLPPAICGVGDHASGVGLELSKSHGCSVKYLGVNPKTHGKPLASLELPMRSAEAMLNSLRAQQLNKSAVLVVHFSGYSYGKHGLCNWLPNALTRFREERPDIRLITMFHELWSPAPILSRHGWLVPLQKRIIKRLVTLSDIVRTNREQYRIQIESLYPPVRGAVRVKNICSNFGEPDSVLPFVDRRKQILIFQPPCLTTAAGRYFWDKWSSLENQLGEIPTLVAGRVREIPTDKSINRIGFVSATEGAQLISESQFAFFDYFPGYLGKSSLFGSLAAYGIVPIMPRLNYSNDEGLFHGTHYLIPEDQALSDTTKTELVSRRLLEWYSDHSIAATASDYMQSLNQTARKSA